MKQLLPGFLLITVLLCTIENLFAQTANTPGSAKRSIMIGQLVPDDSKERARAMIGKSFAAFEGKIAGAGSISSKDLQGKIVFVNFWFSGCEPCIKEMPALNKLYDTLQNDKQFLFLSLSFDSEDEVKKVVKMFDIKYPITMISQDESHRLNRVGGYPTSLLLDKNGIIRWAALGGIEKEIESGQLVNSIYPKLRSNP